MSVNITGYDSLNCELCANRLLPFLVLCGTDIQVAQHLTDAEHIDGKTGCRCPARSFFVPSARNLQELRVHFEESS